MKIASSRPVRSILLALAVTSTCAWAQPATAADWAQWRGPNRDDRSPETGLLKEWPTGGPELLWAVPEAGSGYSGVAVAGNRVYTMGDKGEASYLIALNRADGKPAWSTKVGRAGAPGWGGFAGPRCTPTVEGDAVFAVGQYGEFVCVEAATGKERWRKHFVTDLGGKLPEWGFSESPLAEGNLVVCTPGGSRGAVVALDRKTGAVVWRSKQFTDPAEYSSVISVEINGLRQYIQLTQASVAGIAAKDGRMLWRAARKGNVAVIPTPIFHDNQVYVSSGYGVGCNLFKITASGGTFTSEQVYANKVLENHHGGVVLVGNHLYGHSESKGWTCQEFGTGKAVWQEKGRLGKGSLTYADGHLYLRQEDGKGTIVLIEASPTGYKEKGRFDQPNRSEKNSWPHPVIADGRLYIRDQEVLLAFDVKKR
jgi:outer membrane protein assembly factor BamB